MKRILALILVAALLAFAGAWAETAPAEQPEAAQAEQAEQAESEQPEAEAAEAPAEEPATEEPVAEEPAAEEPAAEEPAAEAPAEEAAEEAPVGRLSGIKIGIDPGHQSNANYEKEAIAPGSKETKPKVSSGGRGVKTGVDEYVVVLDIAMKLRDALEAEGAEVYMTRETHDVNISNQERATMMNELGVDLVLRIHCDSVDTKSARGIGLFVKKTGEIAEPSAKAAGFILDRMVEATGAKKRDTTYSDIYTGLNWSTVPSILVECGFQSNPDEDELLNTPEYQQKLAEGMVAGICDYFER